MHSPLRTALVGALTAATLLAPGPLPGVAYAQAPDNDDDARARRLYGEGEAAYRLGEFTEAAAKFEEAYKLSKLPLILYNIGLAYRRKFDSTGDVADLRKARPVLENFLIELSRDPELGDPTEIEGLLTEIDALIAAEVAKAEARAREQDDVTGPVGPDPGKKDRTVGVALMATGGTLVLGGVGLMVFGAVKIREFERDLNACGTQSCRTTAEDNGGKAELITWVGGLPLTLVGAAILGAGAGVFMRGDKRTKEWKKVSIRAAPVLSPTTTGLVLTGRF